MSEAKLTIAAVGDIGLYNRIPDALAAHGIEAYCGQARAALAGADLRFGNVEIPLMEHGGSDDFSLVGPAHAAEIVQTLGFEVASLANNHMLDAGWDGAQSTRRILEERGIRGFGLGATEREARKPLLIECAGLKLGFLGYSEGQHGRHRHVAGTKSPGVAPIDSTKICEDLRALRGQVDLAIVSMHWGVNYIPYAMPEQRSLARELAAAGADLILGHHPHVPQGIEQIGRTLVAYSLGDFIFDWGGGNVTNQEALARRRRSGILELGWQDGRWERRWIPVYQDEDHRPLIVSGEEAKQQAESLRALDDYYLEGHYPKDPWGDAGKAIGAHASKVLSYHLKRGNVAYLLGKLGRIRGRHAKMIFGWLTSALGRRKKEGS